MTNREYLKIACEEIGAELADDRKGLERMADYPQYRDACKEFGLPAAESLIRDAWIKRAAERLDEFEADLEAVGDELSLLPE